MKFHFLNSFILVLGFGLLVKSAVAGVENERRTGFSEAQIAEISAKFPGCLENTTSSTSESEDQLRQYGGLLPPGQGPAAVTRPPPRKSTQ